MEYEAGDLSAEKTLELFSSLIKSGLAWSLQGHYGRTAERLIDAGYLSRDGEILRKPLWDSGSVEASKRTAAIEELAPVEDRESAIQQTLSHSHTVGMGVAPGASLKETYPEVIHPGAGRVPTRASVDPGAIADWILQAVSYPNRLYTDVQAAFDGMCNSMQETFGKWASPDQKRRVANILRGMGFLVKYEGEKIESYAPPEVRGDVNVYPRGPVGLPPEFTKKAAKAEDARARQAGYELGRASFKVALAHAEAGNDDLAALVKDITAEGYPPFDLTEKGIKAAVEMPKMEFLKAITASMAQSLFVTSKGLQDKAGTTPETKAMFEEGVNAGIRAEASMMRKAPGRPPKDWWDKHYAEVKSGNPSYSDEQVSATVGRIWSDMNKGQKEYRSRGK
jgi:hypothetical protein